MPSEPRTIRGPCFDCDDALDDAWEFCPCRRHFRSTETEPTPKLDPETQRAAEDDVMSQLSAATTEHDPVTCPQCHQNSQRAFVGGYIGGQCRPNPAWAGKAWQGVYGWYPY